MSKRSDKRKREAQRAEAERIRQRKEREAQERAEPEDGPAEADDELGVTSTAVSAAAYRRFRMSHVALVLAFAVFAAGYYWLGREVFARYRLNVVRYPQLLAKKRRVDPAKYDFYLRKAARVFPYDGVLQLELARVLYEQGGVSKYEDALKHNELAFQTHFDVKAYKQRAWIRRWLSEVEKQRNPRAAAEHLKAAIDGFELVLLLHPDDAETLERLAWIYSRAALVNPTPEKWDRSIEYAKRLLDEEYDNTNALYFLGVAYDNLGAKQRAAHFYLRTLEMESQSTVTRKKLWDRMEILKHLKTLEFISEIPEDQLPAE